MVDNSSKCILFVLIYMLGRLKNISYSSCFNFFFYDAQVDWLWTKVALSDAFFAN